MCVYVCIYCVCMCVYMCVCVCVCMCMYTVYVCVYVRVCVHKNHETRQGYTVYCMMHQALDDSDQTRKYGISDP